MHNDVRFKENRTIEHDKAWWLPDRPIPSLAAGGATEGSGRGERLPDLYHFMFITSRRVCDVIVTSYLMGFASFQVNQHGDTWWCD